MMYRPPCASPAIVRIADRWQSAVSFTFVLAVLAALVGITAQYGLENRSGDESSVGSTNQVMYDSEDPSSFPQVPEECVANGEDPADEELTGRSISDWSDPEYTPAKAVTYEQGLAIQETYLAYVRCQEDLLPSSPPAGNGTGMSDVEWFPAALSYFSDRMRYNVLSAELSPAQQAELDAYRCRLRADDILASYPLPVNQPKDYAVLETMLGNEIRSLAFTFAPSDVYLLPDGRYGVISGTISTAALSDPTELTADDDLFFIALVEEDGRYFIDEMFSVLTPDLTQPVVNRSADSPPLTEALYRPDERNRCIFPGR